METSPVQRKGLPEDREAKEKEWRRPPEGEQQGHQKEKEGEQQEVHERSAPSGKIVYKAILKEGRSELERSSSALAWSGLAAGLSMGFSLITEGLLRAHLPEAEWRPLIAKLGYPIGFLIVILGRQQLFTENTLTPVLPLLVEKKEKVFQNVMRLWGVVLVANLVGAAAIAWVIGKDDIFEPNVRAAFYAIGHEAVRDGFGTVLLKGIFAGWLIALMVWLLPFAETARVGVIIIITYVVGLGGFSHIIAGSVDVLALAWAGQKGWWTVIGHWMAPCLIGNIIGGVTLVAALNHAQVVGGGEGEDM